VRCIAVINQKGGVGKTTSTVNIGAALAARGNKVLLLDIDPQANLTLHLDRRPEGDGGTMTDLLVDDKPLAGMMIETGAEGLYMVPSDTSLSGVETMLANRIGRETILREAIEAFDEDDAAPTFDYILLDCPPSLGVLSANALVCADDIIVPMQAEYFSMQGMTKLMEVMQLVKQRLNPELSICLILPCMVDRRTNLTNEVLNELRQHFGDVLAETCIRSNVKLAEAPSFGRTIFEHAPESNGAIDYAVVADELLRRFAGTFEPAPLEEEEDDEYEDDKYEDDEEADEELVLGAEDELDVAESTPEPVSESAIDAGEIVELTAAPIVIDGVPEVPRAEAVPTVEPPVILETPQEPNIDPSLEDGAPFVESVPPTETVPVPASEEPDVRKPTLDQITAPNLGPEGDTANIAVEPEARVVPTVPSIEPAGDPAEHPAEELTTEPAHNGAATPPAVANQVPSSEAPATDTPVEEPPTTVEAPLPEPDAAKPAQSPGLQEGA
jgi:chromosome partitioning protein